MNPGDQVEIGQVWETIPPEYRRTVCVVAIEGENVRVVNVDTGRRGRMKIKTLRRSVLLSPKDAAIAATPPALR